MLRKEVQDLFEDIYLHRWGVASRMRSNLGRNAMLFALVGFNELPPIIYVFYLFASCASCAAHASGYTAPPCLS